MRRPWGGAPQSMTSRMRHGATLLGIPLDIYEMHIEAGELWCSWHQCWHPSSEFTLYRDGRSKTEKRVCLPGVAARQRERYAAKKQRQEGEAS